MEPVWGQMKKYPLAQDTVGTEDQPRKSAKLALTAPSGPHKPKLMNMATLQEQLKGAMTQAWLDIVQHLGPDSQLWVKTKASVWHEALCCKVIENTAGSTLQSYIPKMQQFLSHCQILGTKPGDITEQQGLDFLMDLHYCSKSRGHVSVPGLMLKSLRFLASKAEVQNWQSWLGGALADSFAHNPGKTGPTEKEAPPLPLQSLLGLEQMVMAPQTPQWLVLLGGFFLTSTWASLRFKDAQRTSPNSLSNTAGVIRGRAWQTKHMKKGHAWAIWPYGLCSQEEKETWGNKWLQQLQAGAKADTDYLMPDLVWTKGSTVPEILETPMPPYRMIAYLRLLLTKVVDKSLQIPEDTARTLTTHSCKATLLAWSAQAGVSESDRCLLGHHKPGSKMVAKYSRDDTVIPLATQTLLAQKIREGWRPYTPQERGAAEPLPAPQELTIAPRWKGGEELTEEAQESDSAALTAEESASTSSDSAETDEAPTKEKVEPSGSTSEGTHLAFIYNKAKGCLHIGLECSEDIPANRRVKLEGSWWKVACGALLTLDGAYSLTNDCTVTTNFCGRRGCRNAL